MIHWEFIDWSAVTTFTIWLGVLLLHLRSADVGNKAYQKLDEANDLKSEHIAILEEHIRKLGSIMKAATYVNAMIRGGRPIVTKAPDGMTIEEAQSMIDEIFLTMVKKPEGEEQN